MKAIRDTIETLRMGPEVAFQNLTMFPLLGGTSKPGYQTLDEALAAGTARITEITEGGSVPKLRLHNEGDRPVLLLDGEELIGAKQNRVLNLTILAPAHKTIEVPVSCVESGRWSYQSREFAAAPRAQYAGGRARKVEQVSDSLIARCERSSDQGEVWRDISEKAARLSAESPTGAMAEMYTRHSTSVEEFVTAMPAIDGQCGAVFAIGGRIAGLDLFDCPATYARLSAKLVRSYALDALDPQAATTGFEAKAGVEQASAFLKAAAAAEGQAFPAVGLGEDVRLSGTGLAGGALVVEDSVIHLCAFPSANRTPQEAAAAGGRMARPSVRSRA
jgi:hypothetical protein